MIEQIIDHIQNTMNVSDECGQQVLNDLINDFQQWQSTLESINKVPQTQAIDAIVDFSPIYMEFANGCDLELTNNQRRFAQMLLDNHQIVGANGDFEEVLKQVLKEVRKFLRK